MAQTLHSNESHTPWRLDTPSRAVSFAGRQCTRNLPQAPAASQLTRKPAGYQIPTAA